MHYLCTVSSSATLCAPVQRPAVGGGGGQVGTTETVVARREGDKVVAVLSIAAEETEEEVVQLWKNVRGLRSGTAPLQLSLPHSRKPLFAQF